MSKAVWCWAWKTATGWAQKDKKGKPKFIAEWSWRATTQPGKVYLHLIDWPETMKIPPLDARISKAYLLADPAQAQLAVVQGDGGVSIALPEKAPDDFASVVCLELMGAK